MESIRTELRDLLRERSVCIGEFTLKSGLKSNFYVDCRQTALHPRGAVLIGQVMHRLIRDKAAELDVDLDGVGGLTLGADPVSLAAAIRSDLENDPKPFYAYVVRKEAKEHGRGRKIEGPFQEGHNVVVTDDVITTGGSTLQAVEAIQAAGGKVAFVACLVDRQEGGREAVEAKVPAVVAAFTKSEFLES